MSTAFGTRQTLPNLIISLWLLGFTQIIGYGTLYYGLAIIAEDMATTLGWPVSWIFGAFSLALLAGAVIAPAVGRRIDQHGAAKVMALGSVAAAVSLIITASAPNPLVFVIGLVAMQLATTLVLYDAAFAHLVEVSGPASPRLITYLTLIAGFSSTIFWPLTQTLNEWFSWREILAIFAAMNVAICFPVHLWLARSGTGSFCNLPLQTGVDLPTLDASPLPDHLEQRGLFLVTWGFALSGFLLMAILAQMVPLLSAMGFGSASVMVAALFGPAQVLIRFVNMVLGTERYPLAVNHPSCCRSPADSCPVARGIGPVDVRGSDLRPDPRLCLGAEEHRAGHTATRPLRRNRLRHAIGQDGRSSTGSRGTSALCAGPSSRGAGTWARPG